MVKSVYVIKAINYRFSEKYLESNLRGFQNLGGFFVKLFRNVHEIILIVTDFGVTEIMASFIRQ